MSFPGIFRRLFQKEGAGPLLRKDIIPPHADTHGSAGSDRITPESIGAMPAGGKPGSASSADVAVKLKTARAVDGVNFDGSAALRRYAGCATAAATAAKTVDVTGFSLVAGALVCVRFTNGNTSANPTLNVSGTGAKPIKYRNAAAGNLKANGIHILCYDGEAWEIVGDLDSNTTYTAASAAPKAAGTAAVGTSAKYAREDHVHPAQTSVSGSSGSCTGNAGTATKLATARTISLTGDATGSASFNGSADSSIATTIVGLVPVGGVVAFSGTFSGRNPVDMKSKKPMANWCLCDGTTTNGLAVPDLRDRMIMGAGTTYKTGGKGGSASHTHSLSGTVGATTLTEKQMPSHKHLPSNGTTFVVEGGNSEAMIHSGAPYDGYSICSHTEMKGGSSSHTHSLYGLKSGSTSSLPPYYALAFIMRIV